MKQKPDFLMPLLAIIFTVALISSLSCEPAKSTIETGARESTLYTRMDDAEITVFNVDQIEIDGNDLIIAGHLVETEMTDNAKAVLLQTKEEIAVRIKGDRFSILASDNDL